MTGLAWLITVTAVTLTILVVVQWIVWQRKARLLRRQQESPLVYSSFDVVPGVQSQDIQILSRPGPWPRSWFGVSVPEKEHWYCHAPGIGFFRVTAGYMRTWWGWRVKWELRTLDEDAMRQALSDDFDASRVAFGLVMDSRLYA